MKQILKLVFLLVIGQTAFAQAPSNYTNINGRYRWIAGMFDSTFHIPKGSTPSLRTGGSTNSGGLFYNTSDSSVYTYTGTQWIKLRGSINPSDTTNKYVTQVYKKNASDSVFYVKGGNHLFAFIDSVGSPGGGGGGKVYYFNGGVSMGTFGGFAMYELGDTANTGAAANFTRSTTGNIANFITDPNKPGLLQIPAGVWTVDAWLSETGGGANHAEIYVQVEKWDGSTITTIATSPIEEITEGGTPNLYTWSVSIPTTTLAVTDRIILQFYIQNTNGKTVTLYTQNGYVGEVHTTFTTGIGAINGLTAPAQYLVTGTSGTDFNINSSTATHTFNLPTASATNRGALSTTDWSTFNNKIGGSLVSGYLTKATGTNTIDTSQIYQTNGKIGIGRTNPTAKVDVYDSLGTGIKSTLRTQINTDVALDVKAVGNRGFALIIDQADSSASGTQYQTLFRKSMMPGTGNPANGGGVSWYTQIGNDNNVYRALSVYRARVIDSTGFANSNIQQTSTEFWTRKAGVWDTTLVLNGGNVGINTGQNGIDSALTVANGTWLKRGVRMSALPTGVGTKALRIDANGTLSVADTLTNGVSGSLTANFIPKATGTTTLNNSPLSVGSGVVGLGLGVVPPNSWSNYWALQLANGVSLASYNYADIPIGLLGTNAYHDGIGDIRASNGAANKYLQDRGNHKWYVAGYGASGSYISWTQPMILDTLNRLTIGVTTPDSMFKVAQGVHLERGVRMSGLPTGVGTKAVRINANGTLSVADTLANGISGTGTTNYIPKFTSSSAIGNSIIFDNGTNVGIGTTSPTNKLVVSNAGANGFEVNPNGTGSGTNILSYNRSTSAYTQFTIEGSLLSFATGGSERMRLDASGNLGLGTSAPTSRLEIYNGSGDTRATITSTGGTGASDLLLKNASGTVAYEWYVQALGSDGRFRIFDNAGGSTGERLTIDQSGNLGLGTSSPQSILHLYKASADALLTIERSDGGSGAREAVKHIVGSSTKWTLGTVNTSDFYINVNSAERLRIDASGNLGLGVTPSAWASAGGSAKGFQLGNGGGLYSSGAGNTLSTLVHAGYYNGTNWIYNYSSVSVGRYEITGANAGSTHAWYNSVGGTAGNSISFTQAMTLFSTGNLAVGGTSDNGYRINVTGDVNVGSSNGYYFGGSSTAVYRSTNDLRFYVNSGDRMAITSTGNVGIGTTTPGYELTINDATTTTGGTPRFISVINRQNSTTEGLLFGMDNNANSVIATNNADFRFGNLLTGTFTERMRITSGGNVGIGTTSPSGQLHIKGASGLTNFGTQMLQVESSTDNYSGIVFSGTSGSNAAIRSEGASTMSFWTASGTTYTERMRITSGGNVGIGTSSPAAKLQVSGGSIRLDDGQALEFGGSTNFILGDNTNNLFRFYTNNSEKMRLTSTGELLINTTSDAGDYKLQVNGAIYTNSNITSRGGSFEPTTGTTWQNAAFKTEVNSSPYGGGVSLIDGTNGWTMYLINSGANFRLASATTSTTPTTQFDISNSGNAIFSGSIKTAAPSGGTAKPWKFGEAGVSVGGANTTAVKVEIDGVVYYLLTAYLPEPTPEPAPKPKPEG